MSGVGEFHYNIRTYLQPQIKTYVKSG